MPSSTNETLAPLIDELMSASFDDGNEYGNSGDYYCGDQAIRVAEARRKLEGYVLGLQAPTPEALCADQTARPVGDALTLEWIASELDGNGQTHAADAVKRAAKALAQTQEATGQGAGGDHSKSFQLMLVRIIQRHRNGRDLTETLAGAADLLKRKGSLSVLREDAQ